MIPVAAVLRTDDRGAKKDTGRPVRKLLEQSRCNGSLNRVVAMPATKRGGIQDSF